MLNKAALRRSLLATRYALDTDTRIQWDEAIGRRVHAWLTAHPAQVLGVYWPIQGEPDLRSVYVDLARRGISLALPVVSSKNAPLKFAAWAPDDPLMKDACGVLVPARWSEPVRPNTLLIPCVGFNAQRIRLGYGAGYYDRTLATTPRPATIGIAYTCARAAFDGAPHDIALDTIITEAALITDD